MTRPQTSQSGSVFTILMAGIAIAAALSVVLYSTISGPMSSMVRITNKTQAKAQMQSIASIIIMDAINNLPNNGDCASVGFVVPRSWKTGTGPTGGGILPTTIGAPLTDPWGTNYGYCVWEVGVASKAAACDTVNGADQTCTGISGSNSCSGGVGSGYNATRLLGSPTPSAGSASSQIVFALISAGPNRTFNSTCSAYVNGSSNLAAVGGDDIVVSYTYAQASVATSSLWTLNPASASTAIINKNLAVGPTATPTFQVNSSTGLINALGLTAIGAIIAGGSLQMGGQANTGAMGSCAGANYGTMYYNTTANAIDVCTNAGWTPLAGGGSSSLSGITAATGANTIDSLTNGGQVWNWSTLTAGTTALTLSAGNAAGAADTTLAVTNNTTGAGKAVSATISGASNSGYAVYGANTGTTNTGAAGYFTNTGGGYGLIVNAGNVGIGTTSPTNPLEVVKNQDALTNIQFTNTNNTVSSRTALSVTSGPVTAFLETLPSNETGFPTWANSAVAGSNSDMYVGPWTANKLYFETGGIGTARMTIDSAGLVGIGTTGPTSKLGIVGTASEPTLTAGSAALLDLYASGAANLVFTASNASPYTVSMQARNINTNGNSYPIALNPLGGNVGIGTTAPGQPLQVNGNIFINGSDGTGELMLGSCCQSTLYRASSDGSLHIVSGQANIDLTPISNVIVTQGNLGIGTAAPVAKLAVNGQVALGSGASANNYGYDLYVDAQNPTIFLDGYANSSTSSIILQNRNSGGTASDITIGSTTSNGLSITGGNVGIGTTSPVEAFQVHLGTNNNFGVFGSNVPVAIGAYNDVFNAWDDLQVGDNLYVKASGNVGIGTTNPSATLDVTSTNACCGNNGIGVTGNVADLSIGIKNTSAGGHDWRILSSGTGSGIGVGNLNFYDQSGGGTRLSINTSGNVGIGTASPGYTLDVNGTINSNNQISGNELYSRDNVYLGYLGDYISNRLNQPVTTGASPTFTELYVSNWFRVNGSGGIYWQAYGGGWFMQDGTWIRSYNGKPVLMGGGYDSSTGSGANCGGAGVGTGYAFYVCGTLYTTTGGSISDRRHKKDIQPYAPDAIGIVEKLKPVTFLWKEQKDEGTKGRQIGFIAQDVQPVVPDAVLTGTNAEKTLALKYDSFIPILTKAIQEQQAEIEALKAANDNWRSQIKADNDALKADDDKLKAANDNLQKRDDELERAVAALKKEIHAQ